MENGYNVIECPAYTQHIGSYQALSGFFCLQLYSVYSATINFLNTELIWQAGANQPSPMTGAIVLFIHVYIFIIGERSEPI